MWNSCSSFRLTTSEGTTIGKATYKNVYSEKIYVGFIKVHQFSSNYAETVMQNLHHYLQLWRLKNNSVFQLSKPSVWMWRKRVNLHYQ